MLKNCINILQHGNPTSKNSTEIFYVFMWKDMCAKKLIVQNSNILEET